MRTSSSIRRGRCATTTAGGRLLAGLRLAFLLKGHQQRSQLNFRPFTDQAADLSSGSSPDDFHRIVRRVIDIPNGGQTRIQKALEQAVQDIRKAGPCLRADVMLISDGISRLTENPFHGEHLHTFLVADLMSEDESTGIIATLREWSTTFRRVWKSRFKEILTPRSPTSRPPTSNCVRWPTRRRTRDAARLHQMLENVKYLAERDQEGDRQEVTGAAGSPGDRT